MDWQVALDVLLGIVTGIHVQTILGLILLDVALGIAEAIKLKKFDLYFVADFYQSMVLPYLVAFAALSGVTKIVSIEALGPWGYLVGDGLMSLAWLAIVGNIGKSILGHLSALAIPLPEADALSDDC